MAFETKYDVSTHVDSSAPADKFPEMCGNATLAMEVSSTSMNVASVTVTAITQGLIVPSGIRSLAKILFRIVHSSLPFPLYLVLLFPTHTYFALFPLFLKIQFVTTVASTFIPGRRIAFSCEIGSNMIFTGMRCTTFT